MTTFYALKRKTTGTMEPTLYKSREAAQAKADQRGLYSVVDLLVAPVAEASSERPETAMEHIARDMRDGIFPARSERKITTTPMPVAETAGEAVAWRYRYPNDTDWQITQDHDQAFRNTGEVEPLGVIPFGVPAQDDDKLREEETEVQYEVWGAGPQGDFCAGADTLSDAQHYAVVYGQDGPVVIKVATTTRVVWAEASPALKSTAAQEGGGK